MNQAQADKIIKVINQDANSRHSLFPSPGKACVIGGLLEAWRPNVRNEYTQGASQVSWNDIAPFNFYYNLHSSHPDQLMLTNDRYQFTLVRRHALRKLVQSWVTE